MVSIASTGEAHYIFGLLRKEDEAEIRNESRNDSNNAPMQDGARDEGATGIVSLADDPEKPAYSAALVESLTTYKTAAIAAELTQNPHVALAAMVHANVLRVFGLDLHVYREASCLQVLGSAPNLLQAKGSKAATFLEEQRVLWLSQLPRDERALWSRCVEQDDSTLLRLLAFVAATSLDAIQGKPGNGADRVPHANSVAAALGMDMTQWFTRTAENVFDRLSKAGICEALRQAGKDGGSSRAAMKKSELSKLAEQELAGTGWLPEPLRIQTETPRRSRRGQRRRRPKEPPCFGSALSQHRARQCLPAG